MDKLSITFNEIPMLRHSIMENENDTSEFIFMVAQVLVAAQKSLKATFLLLKKADNDIMSIVQGYVSMLHGHQR
ncbi:hypothetical protein [Desulfofarcimen acetoxidans]|nr:hypothetical protein [Desulfofarcimen acetoxidans]